MILLYYVRSDEMTDCASILLAAGGSSRLGQPKQMLRVGLETLLRRTAKLACEAGCFPNLVVLGAYAEQLLPELSDLPLETIVNHDWQQGIGSSLSLGMTHLHQHQTSTKAVLLLVCDQPALNAEHLQNLIAQSATSGKSIVASRYAETLGVPAIFTCDVFPALARLSGDQGARRLFAMRAADTAAVDFPDGAFDVDTYEDAQRLWRYSMEPHQRNRVASNQ